MGAPGDQGYVGSMQCSEVHGVYVVLREDEVYVVLRGA
jgi:hypothetical protein